MTQRYVCEELRDFAKTLLSHANLPEDKATVVAEILVEGDLPGHATHGISASTTNGMTGRLHANGEHLPGPWLVDHAGNATDDPAVLSRQTAGAILPLGGQDLGHKGFGLALMVEALTSAPGGFGRADGS